ncbi:MAG: response regulator transcription factor [Candidatus Gastranaerophilales bacterium]|nr:response regulator transcription factor [Candidatus Gastranaerophilales bacterium]
MKRNVFIIDDELEMLEILKVILLKQGFLTHLYSEGRQALQDIEQIQPDLILLDLMLPDMSGLEICSVVKNNPKTRHIPIIALTSKSDNFDVMTGLNMGCDDYITKPFNNQVLIARINAVLRRTESNKNDDEASIIICKNILLDTEKYEARINNELIQLSALEFKTLCFFVKNKERVFTRAQIMESIRDDYYFETEERAIDCLISRLRKKLGDCGHYIESVYGVGYCFKESEKTCV